MQREHAHPPRQFHHLRLHPTGSNSFRTNSARILRCCKNSSLGDLRLSPRPETSIKTVALINRFQKGCHPCTARASETVELYDDALMRSPHTGQDPESQKPPHQHATHHTDETLDPDWRVYPDFERQTTPPAYYRPLASHANNGLLNESILDFHIGRRLSTRFPILRHRWKLLWPKTR